MPDVWPACGVVHEHIDDRGWEVSYLCGERVIGVDDGDRIRALRRCPVHGETSPVDDPYELISVAEAARRLKTSEATMYRWLHSADRPPFFVRIGKRWRVAPVRLEEYRQARITEARSEA